MSIGRVLSILLGRKAEKKGRTFIYLRFSPDAPTVLVNDSLHGGQSHASNFEVFLAVKTLKDAKQLGGILILKPTPLSRTKFTG